MTSFINKRSAALIMSSTEKSTLNSIPIGTMVYTFGEQKLPKHLIGIEDILADVAKKEEKRRQDNINRRDAQRLKEMEKESQLLEKAAESIGDATERELEQKIGQIGYVVLKDRVPRLMDYLIGFRLLKRSEDNLRAVGVFGFALGGDYAYVPVFFLKGQVKGQNLLYVRSKDMFVPLTESWVNNLIGRTPEILGESLGNLGEKNVRTPNMSFVQGSFDKFSEEMIDPTLGEDVLPYFAKRLLTDVEKYAEDLDAVNPSKVIAESPELCERAYSWYEKYPVWKQSFDNVFGDNFFTDVMKSLADRCVKLSEEEQAEKSPLLDDVDLPAGDGVLTTTFDELVKSDRDTLDSLRYYDESARPVKVIREDIEDNLLDLTDGEKTEILQEGRSIRDRRTKKEQISVLYRGGDIEFTKPSKSGPYKVFMKDGKLKKIFFFQGPAYPIDETEQGPWPDSLQDARVSKQARRTLVWAPGNEPQWEKFEDTAEIMAVPGVIDENWYEKLSGTPLTQVKPVDLVSPINERKDEEDWYVVISREGGYAGPFKVLQKTSDGILKVRYTTYGNPVFIQMSRVKKGTAFLQRGNMLYPPADAKILRLGSIPRTESEFVTPTKYGVPFSFGMLDDFKATIQQVQWPDKIKIFAHTNRTNDTITINGHAYEGLKEAEVHLVCDLGFDRPTANELLKEALEKSTFREPVEYMCKLSYQPHWITEQRELNTDFTAPPFRENTYWTDDYLKDVVIRDGYKTKESVPGYSDTVQQRFKWDQSQMPDPVPLRGQEAQSAVDAEQSGHKDVYGLQTLVALLRRTDNQSLLRRNAATITKAMTAIGSLLFQFYWKHDEFVDQFGKSGAPEFEDCLLSTFEQLGELALYMKRQHITADESSGDVGNDVDE